MTTATSSAITSPTDPHEPLTPDAGTSGSDVGSQRFVAGPAAEVAPVPHAPRTERQAINHCPYCAEENLFPLEGGGWECRSCRRAFSVTFRGLVPPGRRGGPEAP